ncbi:MAG: prepilin-type cleavage/methylation domain-containing protein [Gammaproteobacteria bacterium]|nr:prepilin-type cleavage/methylation domain-containing protein [Gammaproteobacteria bacterium]
MSSTRQNGFTLVEIALILAIIGILIGGVLKGQEMIINAKIKRLESDNSGLVAAMFTYQDRYIKMPGDDDRASARFSLYNDGVNDPAPTDINGDADGSLGGDWIAATNTETANFWKHLRASGLIPGGGDDDTQPSNAYGGLIGIRDDSLLIPGHAIIYGSIEGAIAKILESRIDDGIPISGRIQSDLTPASMNINAISTAGPDYLDSLRYFMAIRI